MSLCSLVLGAANQQFFIALGKSCWAYSNEALVAGKIMFLGNMWLQLTFVMRSGNSMPNHSATGCRYLLPHSDKWMTNQQNPDVYRAFELLLCKHVSSMKGLVMQSFRLREWVRTFKSVFNDISS